MVHNTFSDRDSREDKALKILWDFDATLADGPRLWSRAAEALLKESGVQSVDRSKLRAHLSVGFPWHEHSVPHRKLFGGWSFWDHMGELMKLVCGQFSVNTPSRQEMGIKLRAWVLRNHSYRAIPGAREVLNELSGIGYTHIIASNHIPELPELVRDVGLRDCFAKIYTSGKVGFEKPNPKFFDHILSREEPSTVLCMVGDSYERDYLGARSAGIEAIWFDRSEGITSAEDIANRARSLSEIPKMLGTIRSNNTALSTPLRFALRRDSPAR